ncbi:MAG: helicase-associated domain-containing protein [Marmoricola sp.]
MSTRTEGPPRTVAELLRSWSAAELTALLTARPDLAVPAPADSAQLAARAVTRASVLRALDGLDQLHLAVLEAVATTGPTTAPAVRQVVRTEDPATVDRALEALAAALLVWYDGSGLRPVTMVAELVGVPAGPDAGAVPVLLGELDDRARAMLDHLEATGADGSVEAVPARLTTESATTPLEQLLARRLLVPREGSSRRVTLPWSVRLALRGGRSTRDPVDVPPVVPTDEVDRPRSEHAGAGSAHELLHRVELLLDRWETHPPAVLRAGGLGVRELRAAAGLLQVDPALAVLVVELTAAAGLLAVGSTDDLDAAWLPTDRYDAWLAAPAAERWATLAAGWLAVPRDPALASPDRADRVGNALGDGLERSWLPGLRRDVLDQVARLPAGHGLAAGTGLAGLLDRLRWHRPRRPVEHERAVPDILDQAVALGLVAGGACPPYTAALLAGDDPAPVLAPLLPEPVDHVLLQADLTAIAPGPLTPELGRTLGLLAEVESRGGATVYRFTASSVRRAFDAGWSAAEVHDAVAAASRTPVPQALDYLVDDVARRFGVLRVGHATAFLRSDDETALAELVHSSRAEALRLRRLAPTVLVSDVPLDILLPRLRELGLGPVVEAPDGTVRVARPDVHRARLRRTGADGRRTARAGARTAAAVAAIQAGDRAGASRPSQAPVSSPADVVSLLRGAVESGAHVLLGYVGADGTVTERLVRPVRVEGGRLTAHDERADDEREFALHRITAAALTTSDGAGEAPRSV